MEVPLTPGRDISIFLDDTPPVISLEDDDILQTSDIVIPDTTGSLYKRGKSVVRNPIQFISAGIIESNTNTNGEKETRSSPSYSRNTRQFRQTSETKSSYNNNQQFAFFSKFSKGIGLKILQKYDFRYALGKNEQGLRESIPIIQRPKNAGIGSIKQDLPIVSKNIKSKDNTSTDDTASTTNKSSILKTLHKANKSKPTLITVQDILQDIKKDNINAIKSSPKAEIIYDLRGPNTRVIYLDGTYDINTTDSTAEYNTIHLDDTFNDLEKSIETLLQLYEYDVITLHIKSNEYTILQSLDEQEKEFKILEDDLKNINISKCESNLDDIQRYTPNTWEKNLDTLDSTISILLSIFNNYTRQDSNAIINNSIVSIYVHMYRNIIEQLYTVGYTMSMNSNTTNDLHGIRNSFQICIEHFKKSNTTIFKKIKLEGLNIHIYIIVYGILYILKTKFEDALLLESIHKISIAIEYWCDVLQWITTDLLSYDDNYDSSNNKYIHDSIKVQFQGLLYPIVISTLYKWRDIIIKKKKSNIIQLITPNIWLPWLLHISQQKLFSDNWYIVYWQKRLENELLLCYINILENITSLKELNTIEIHFWLDNKCIFVPLYWKEVLQQNIKKKILHLSRIYVTSYWEYLIDFLKDCIGYINIIGIDIFTAQILLRSSLQLIQNGHIETGFSNLYTFQLHYKSTTIPNEIIIVCKILYNCLILGIYFDKTFVAHVAQYMLVAIDNFINNNSNTNATNNKIKNTTTTDDKYDRNTIPQLKEFLQCVSETYDISFYALDTRSNFQRQQYIFGISTISLDRDNVWLLSNTTWIPVSLQFLLSLQNIIL